MGVNMEEVKRRFGFELRMPEPTERAQSMRAMLAKAPLLHDVARGGDVTMCADLILHSLDETLEHVLGHVIRLDDGVSHRGVTMIAMLELLKMLEEQFETMAYSMMPVVAYHVEAYVSSLPPDVAKDIEDRTKEQSKQNLGKIIEALFGDRRD